MRSTPAQNNEGLPTRNLHPTCSQYLRSCRGGSQSAMAGSRERHLSSHLAFLASYDERSVCCTLDAGCSPHVVPHRAPQALHHLHGVTRQPTPCTVVHGAPEPALAGGGGPQGVSQGAGARACCVVEAPALPHAALDQRRLRRAQASALQAVMPACAGAARFSGSMACLSSTSGRPHQQSFWGTGQPNRVWHLQQL